MRELLILHYAFDPMSKINTPNLELLSIELDESLYVDIKDIFHNPLVRQLNNCLERAIELSLLNTDND